MNDFSASVVIPCYKTWDLCRKLVNSLAKYEGETISEIIVVNDQPDMTAEMSRELLAGSKIPLRILRNDINLGFTLSSNLGLSAVAGNASENKIVFLISTDVRIMSKFVDDTADILLGAKRYLVGNRYIWWDSGWNTFSGRTFPYLEGWFLAATNHAWRDFGYFDPAYSPYDYEDIDLSTTAVKRGYKLAALNNPNIVHLGAGTIGYNETRLAITERNKKYFQEKWMP